MFVCTHNTYCTHTHTHTQVAYPDPDLNPRAFAKYGAVKDSCVLAFRREIEMMALVGNHYAEKNEKGKRGKRNDGAGRKSLCGGKKRNHCAGREALVCGGPNSLSTYFTYFTTGGES
jgi:hypothetical protein